jgi:iron only hydrogenase large subunit-like protein
MRSCPTEALRIHNGKAVLLDNKCIDCGECFRVCPVSAISVAEDDLNELKKFSHRVALIPAVFFGQFPENISHQTICSAIYKLGFTDIYEIERVAGYIAYAQHEYIKSAGCPNGPVSSYCPAIIRLIQVKFPGLVDNIIPVKPPVDLAAIECRKSFLCQGITEEEIGLFYFTPCAAKIAAVKSPVGDDKSPISGVVTMSSIYNKVLKIIRKDTEFPESSNIPISPDKKGILWALTHGEARLMNGRVLSIDGISNVIDFLEKLEDDEPGKIDYLEMRACDQSCAGGILVSGNRFLTAEKLYKKAALMEEESALPGSSTKQKFLLENIWLNKINPRTSLALDPDMHKAMDKMQKVTQLLSQLPGIDCGLCGSPSCQSFAEDIVKGEAELPQCVFVMKGMENSEKISQSEGSEIMKNIWGTNRFNQKK